MPSGSATIARTVPTRLALLDGEPDLIWTQGGELKVAFAFTMDADRITAIDLLADAEVLATLDWAPL